MSLNHSVAELAFTGITTKVDVFQRKPFYVFPTATATATAPFHAPSYSSSSSTDKPTIRPGMIRPM